MPLAYSDGQWLPDEQIVFPSNDLAVQRGFGLFETMRARGTTIFHPERHLVRMRRSAELIGLAYPWSDEAMLRLWNDAIGQNGFDETSLKVILTGGSAEFLEGADQSRLVILPKHAHGYPAEHYAQGVGLRTSRLGRIMPEAKSLSYLPSVIAWRTAQAAGDHEALFVGADNRALECATANFFVVRDRQLITASEEILLGTTRELILELAAEHSLATQVQALPLAEALAADEAFITSVNRKIMPVVRIDGHPIGSGQIGPVTQLLTQAFSDHEARYFD